MSSEHSRIHEWAELIGEDIDEDVPDGDRSGRSTGARGRWLEQSS